MKKPLYAYLVRHGQTDWNVLEKVQGHRDIPLNKKGKEEAKNLSKTLQNTSFSAHYSSDLKRAHETAQILTEYEHPIQTDQRLRERNLGSWEGKLYHHLDNAPPEKKTDVESNLAMKERTFHFLTELTDKHSAGNILVVTHGGIIRNLLVHLLSLPEEEIITPNTGLCILKFEDSTWSVHDLHNIEIATAK